MGLDELKVDQEPATEGTVYVDPANAKIPRINPLKGNAPLESVNGGTYSAHADLIGVGLAYAM